MNEREILLLNSLQNLHLMQKAPKERVVRDLLGLQAQFSRNPQISLFLRASDYAPETWDEGLVKIWSHRGTIHVIDERELGMYLSAAGHTGPLGENYWGITQEQAQKWSPFLQNEVLAGNDTREGMKEACRRAGMDEELLGRVFYGWGGLIKEMCWRGLLACRTGTDKRYLVPEKPVFMDRDEARKELIRRYFDVFGPATVQDCAAFFLWKMTEIRPMLEEILPGLHCTKIDGKTYYHARPLQEEGEIPPCVLAPGFDQLIMGYRDRTRYIDKEHNGKLVNVAGIVFPAVILRGRIRAKWKLDGAKIVVTPFERLLKKDEAAMKREVKAKFGKTVREIVYEQ
ncbi:MAG: AlkZ family DNA glycosylase [Clostridia bacterium]|nr:AlkZ family DNA glycosylase [Clostridia bacterium]